MNREEGHYTLKRVENLPKKGNSNILYALKTDPLDKLYKWERGVYLTINLGGSGGSGTPSALNKSYVALLSQSGTSAPVITVLENTFDNPIVWSRAGIGNYLATSSGEFSSNKSTMNMLNQNGGGLNEDTAVQGEFQDVNVLSIESSQTGVNADDVLDITSIEIKVYN